MKKIDKLILTSFMGPFIMTFLVVVFILLTRHMLLYFDDIIGKDLGWNVLSQLFFYFAVFMIPIAMPLSILLSTLVTFGNLGEHFELTAIKSAGISLLRVLQPLFFFVVILTGITFYINNNLVPKAALEAYSLLYDIQQKKPAMNMQEGTFYNGLPGISIKINKKFPDGITLKDIIIYDHRRKDENKEVMVADSGRMSTILGERYLKFELFNGYHYLEGNSEGEITGQQNSTAETLTRRKFFKTQVVFDLSSFQLFRTDKKGFETHRIMRNLDELDMDVDSISRKILQQELNHDLYQANYFSYFGKNSFTVSRSIPKFGRDTDFISRNGYRSEEKRWKKSLSISEEMKLDPSFLSKTDSLLNLPVSLNVAQAATNRVRQVKNQMLNNRTAIENYENEKTVFEIQWHKIIASSLMCMVMFLVGAPLGAIIKRGGLGVPFLVSISFFVIYYILSMQGEKLALQHIVSPVGGAWTADVILFLIGLIFLRQARLDSGLFEPDSYAIYLYRLRQWVVTRKCRCRIAA